MRRKTLFIVTELGAPIENYWRECWWNGDFAKYDIKIVDGTTISHESALFADTYYKSIQLKVLMNMVETGKIRDGDVFIFTNAWNYIAVPLCYFRDEYKLNITMIGVWGDSLYNQFSPMWQRFKGASKTFGRQFEYALFNAYDYNCFLSENEIDLFEGKYGRVANSNSIRVTGYPFEYLSRVKKVDIERENFILFPYKVTNDMQVNAFRGLEGELSSLNFIYTYDTHSSRTAYRNLLQQSKLMFCSQVAETNPVLLWEGMCNGVVPMVPSRLMYYQVFPKEYQYPSLLTKARHNKYLYLMRSRAQLADLFIDRVGRYDEIAEKMKSDTEQITAKYYSNKPFVNLLKEL